MNFDFSDEQKQLRDEARKFLAEKCPPKAVRAVLDGKAPYDRELWKGLAEMGFLGVAIPEAIRRRRRRPSRTLRDRRGNGPRAGAGAVFVDRLSRGRSDPARRQRCAKAEMASRRLHRARRSARWRCSKARATRRRRRSSCSASGGSLNGVKKPVPDGAIADFAIVAARTGSTGRDTDISLFLVDMKAGGVEAKALTNVDPSRGQAELTFKNCKAEPLGRAGEGWSILSQVLDRAAVLMAFEQVGGADRALEMGRDYALDRIAFGRPIGSFQAVKHILADMYVSATLARSNCYYGAWALSTNASELPEAAAAARISATQAFQHCAKNNIQVHGGMGFTWEFDCHMYYRRANATALGLGSLSYWEDALIDRMRKRNAA